MVMGTSSNSYLPSFSMEGDACRRSCGEMQRERTGRGMVGMKERKQGVVLKLCTQWLRLSRLQQSLSDPCSTRKRAAWIAYFCMMRYNSLLSQDGSVRSMKKARRRKLIEEAQESLLHQASEDGYYHLL